MEFWRTYDNKVYSAGSVDRLGFPTYEPSYITDEYLEAQNFVILRTCFGIGDWGIISAFPRKLKEKYPNCKVWIPSPKLLRDMFGHLEQNWSSWDDPFQVVHTIFDNNPYVDGFIDSFEGEVFNDHYRITDGTDVPLMEEILRFWQFDNFEDIEPELYWTDSEIKLGDDIIMEHSNGIFGTLLISNRYDGEGRDLIQQKLDEYTLPIFYWTSERDSGFQFIKALDMRHIDIRIQLYIKSEAYFNVGNQTGMNDTIAKYTPTFTVPRGKLGSNFIRSENYMVSPSEDILSELPDKWEVKTTTSKRWKRGLYDFINLFNVKSVLEIGTSLGHTAYFIAQFVDKVTTVEVDSTRVQKAKVLSEKHNNINFICQSAYGTEWGFGYHDLTIIDCIHEYDYVKMDIDNAIKLRTKYIAFDDYGLFPEIKQAIDEYISDGKLELITKIGYPKGTHFHMSLSTNTTPDKILIDAEGIICRVL
jgi:SAM-dependent methyltransferase